MVWVYLILVLAVIIGIGIYFERKGNITENDADMSKEEKEKLHDDYVRKGSSNETDDDDKL